MLNTCVKALIGCVFWPKGLFTDCRRLGMSPSIRAYTFCTTPLSAIRESTNRLVPSTSPTKWLALTMQARPKSGSIKTSPRIYQTTTFKPSRAEGSKIRPWPRPTWSIQSLILFRDTTKVEHSLRPLRTPLRPTIQRTSLMLWTSLGTMLQPMAFSYPIESVWKGHKQFKTRQLPVLANQLRLLRPLKLWRQSKFHLPFRQP